ncbi:hypothetical protein [Polynucleobacter sp. AP-Ainpum-60-G11]|uniref:hypothetical protein n=1 Tax=Polynucleobacter sp. AP-Ainpum-60-G11 TaxID=2576926 RepID=UPI001BFED2CE|nr:hypothetical protein [Polynucleobacter sp. AP-Ainpum-60-G11]QWE26496.1 hypothetical protein FD971_08610 [Polynucleobacter sp. AP-Ainpum-60-G11]
MTNIKFSLFAFVALLVGCATTANYEKILKTTIGKTEKELVAVWGIPQGSYENEGIRYLTYSRSESGVIPGQQPRANTTYINGKAYTTLVGGTPSIGYTNACTTIFKIENKVVISYEYKGNDCKAYDRS